MEFIVQRTAESSLFSDGQSQAVEQGEPSSKSATSLQRQWVTTTALAPYPESRIRSSIYALSSWPAPMQALPAGPVPAYWHWKLRYSDLPGSLIKSKRSSFYCAANLGYPSAANRCGW